MMNQVPKKNKGTSTCFACGFIVENNVNHLQVFDNHLKAKKHPEDQAWHCQVDDCRRRKFKEGGNRTCTKEKPYFRVEDQVYHETEQDYYERNKEKIEAEKIKKSTCIYCGKFFSDRSERYKHEKYEKCKYNIFPQLFLNSPEILLSFFQTSSEWNYIKHGHYFKFSKYLSCGGIISNV